MRKVLMFTHLCLLNVLCSRLRERTHSLWAFLMSEKQNYLNPFYSPAYSELHPVLEPSTLPYHFKSVQPSSTSRLLHVNSPAHRSSPVIPWMESYLYVCVRLRFQGSGGTCTTSSIAPCTHVSLSSKPFWLWGRTVAKPRAQCKHWRAWVHKLFWSLKHVCWFYHFA